jgi:thioredoxin-related protein
MKYACYYIIVLLLLDSALVHAGENELKWLPFTQGLTEAKKSDKKILVDVYTDWCGWCKVMDKNTYSDTLVISLINKHFIPVKLNAESSNKVVYDNKTFTEQSLARAFGVDGYPTTLFLDSDGNSITSADGYIKPEMFIDMLRFIGEDHFKNMDWEEYQKGHKSKEKNKK